MNVVEPKPLTIPCLGTKNRLSEKFDSHRVGIVVQKIAAPHGFADLLAEALAEQKPDIMYRVDRNNFYQNEKKATVCTPDYVRSEEHTPKLQSLMRTSYAAFCLKKKKTQHQHTNH